MKQLSMASEVFWKLIRRGWCQHVVTSADGINPLERPQSRRNGQMDKWRTEFAIPNVAEANCCIRDQ